MAADVAGYSRLMHNDEEATHAKLTTLLTEAVAPAIAEHGGRIVKNTAEPHDIFGDGVNIAARLESIAEPGWHMHLVFRLRSCPRQGRG